MTDSASQSYVDITVVAKNPEESVITNDDNMNGFKLINLSSKEKYSMDYKAENTDAKEFQRKNRILCIDRSKYWVYSLESEGEMTVLEPKTFLFPEDCIKKLIKVNLDSQTFCELPGASSKDLKELAAEDFKFIKVYPSEGPSWMSRYAVGWNSAAIAATAVKLCYTSSAGYDVTPWDAVFIGTASVGFLASWNAERVKGKNPRAFEVLQKISSVATSTCFATLSSLPLPEKYSWIPIVMGFMNIACHYFIY